MYFHVIPLLRAAPLKLAPPVRPLQVKLPEVGREPEHLSGAQAYRTTPSDPFFAYGIGDAKACLTTTGYYLVRLDAGGTAPDGGARPLGLLFAEGTEEQHEGKEDEQGEYQQQGQQGREYIEGGAKEYPRDTSAYVYVPGFTFQGRPPDPAPDRGYRGLNLLRARVDYNTRYKP
jgi:hypothetical protein